MKASSLLLRKSDFGLGAALTLATVLGFPFFSACSSTGHDDSLTYCEIEPILIENCVACHNDRPDALGGISLMTYEEVFTERAQIADYVDSGFMPLEGNDEYPVRMTEEDRHLLVTWADGAAREGDCDE